jgi:hypothetical protein
VRSLKTGQSANRLGIDFDDKCIVFFAGCQYASLQQTNRTNYLSMKRNNRAALRQLQQPDVRASSNDQR